MCITARWIAWNLLGCVISTNTENLLTRLNLKMTDTRINKNMNRRITIDPSLEQDVNRLMVCAPLQCSRQSSCFRVARFARDKIREFHSESAKDAEPPDVDVEQYAMTKLYQDTGAWETA